MHMRNQHSFPPDVMHYIATSTWFALEIVPLAESLVANSQHSRRHSAAGSSHHKL